MIYEDLIVEDYSTLMVVVVTNLKWTSFSLNEFTMNLQQCSAFYTIAGWYITSPIIFPVSVQSLVEHIKYMRETHIEYTETFTARNAHLIETKRTPLKRTLIVTTLSARNAHLIVTKRSPQKRTLIVTTFDEQLVSLSSPIFHSIIKYYM